MQIDINKAISDMCKKQEKEKEEIEKTKLLQEQLKTLAKK